MFHQIINTIFKSQRKNLLIILKDIDFFNKYIYENGEIYNESDFEHLIKYKFWNYLNYYPGLSATEQDKLITGCLNFILFLNHLYISDKGTFIQIQYSEINKAISSFKPVTKMHIRLHFMVREAMIISWKKINRMDYHGQQNIIYQSISWTLKNTILNNENPPEKIKNQR